MVLHLSASRGLLGAYRGCPSERPITAAARATTTATDRREQDGAISNVVAPDDALRVVSRYLAGRDRALLFPPLAASAQKPAQAARKRSSSRSRGGAPKVQVDLR